MPGREAKPLEYSPNGVLYLGSALRSARQARDWRLADVARPVGCTISALSNIETNRVVPSARLLEQLARVLSIPLADLQACPTPPSLGTAPRPRVPAQPVRTNANGRHSSPAAPVRRTDAVTEPPPPPELAVEDGWRVGRQVEAIIASFQLAPAEDAFVGTLVVELTRSLCVQLKDRSLPARLGLRA